MELIRRLKEAYQKSPFGKWRDAFNKGIIDGALDLVDGIFPGAASNIINALSGKTSDERKMARLDEIDKEITEALSKLPPADASKLNAALNNQTKAMALAGKTFATDAVAKVQAAADKRVAKANQELENYNRKRDKALSDLQNIRTAAEISLDRGPRLSTRSTIDALNDRIRNIPNNFEQGV